MSNLGQHLATLKQTLHTHGRWILGPLVLFPVLAAAYALLAPPSWKASQAILVRDEARAGERGVGRFESVDAMKTAQETILEVARNRKVVAAALKAVGPPANKQAARDWPADADVEALLQAISVTAPSGAEFGRTEVIYLAVTAETRPRAIALASAVCNALEKRLQQLRNAKAKSVIQEIEKTLALNRADLEVSTAKLEAMERSVGADLGELRIMTEQGAGDSNLRSAANQIKNELRRARANRDSLVEQLRFLREAQQDPARIVAMPNRLLETQPALRRLKDGLVDAQLRASQLAGTRSSDHPLVKSARVAVEEVRRDLRDELAVALRGAVADRKLSERLVGSLERQEADVDGRLQRLASQRARYGNLVAEVKQKTAIVAQSTRNLAEARASQNAARAASLLTRLDTPQCGNRPVGPGKTTILLAGIGGGLLSSVGLLLLATPASLSLGRRMSDRLLGRRRDDSPRTGSGGGSARGRRGEDGQTADRQGRRGDDSRGQDGQIVSRPATGRRESDPPPETPESARTDDTRRGERRQGDRRRASS